MSESREAPFPTSGGTYRNVDGRLVLEEKPTAPPRNKRDRPAKPADAAPTAPAAPKPAG